MTYIEQLNFCIIIWKIQITLCIISTTVLLLGYISPFTSGVLCISSYIIAQLIHEEVIK